MSKFVGFAQFPIWGGVGRMPVSVDAKDAKDAENKLKVMHGSSLVVESLVEDDEPAMNGPCC